MAIQLYKAHSPIHHTCFLLGYASELLGLLLQLHGSIASCSDLPHSCSDVAASCSNRTPFWYSRSRALDLAMSRSRWALWMFLSIRLIASLSFSFSSVRGSILFISWRRCSVVRVISCKCTMTMSKSNSQCQRGAFQMRY